MTGIEYDEWDWSGFEAENPSDFAEDEDRFSYIFLGYEYDDEMDNQRQYAFEQYEEAEEEYRIELEEEDREKEEEKYAMEEELENLCYEIEDLSRKISAAKEHLTELKKELIEKMILSGQNTLYSDLYQFEIKQEMKVVVQRRYSDRVYDILREHGLDCRKDNPQRRKLAIEILYGENEYTLPDELAHYVTAEIVPQLKIRKL